MKLYPEGYGIGFNFYYTGWRVLGIDWHQWQVRQDLKTGKPLHPTEQFLLNRPHIDMPPLDIHHWPWQKRIEKINVEQLKEKKKAMREEKMLRKLEKKRRRDERRSLQSSNQVETTTNSP